MNNPIGRMPNPMMVPPISPIGNTGSQQPPSAVPLPVVNQPSVDMQMGNTANQRRRFNDLLESLSAPRQKSEDLPDVQGLHYGGMAGGFGMPMMPPMMSPYMGMGMGYGGMGGFGGMGGLGMFGSPFAYNATQPLNSGNPFGNTISPAVPTVAPSYGNMDSGTFPDTSGNYIPRIPGVGMRDRAAVIDPNSPQEIEKSKVLQDFLSSLGTVPMNNVQPFQGLQGYAKGGGVGRMREAKLKRLDPLAENRLGTNEEAAARSRAIQSQVDKLIKGSYFSGPDKRAQDDPRVAYDMGVRSTYDSNPIVMPGDAGYDKARGLQHGNFSLPGTFNSLMGLHDMVIPDFVKDREGNVTFKDRMLQPEETLPSTTTDRNLLGVALDAANPISALGREASGPINTLLDKTGINSVISDVISNLDLEDVTNVLNPVGFAMDKTRDAFGFANGGEVQYLRGGGPTNPISKTKIVPFVEKEKDYNLDKTIPDFFTKTLPGVLSNVKDFMDTPVLELFTGPGAGPDINQDIRRLSGPQGPAGLLPQANVDTTQQVNFDEPSPIKSGPDYSSLPINYTGNFTQPKEYNREEQLAKPLLNMIMENAQNPGQGLEGRLDEFGVPISNQTTTPINIPSFDFGTFDESTIDKDFPTPIPDPYNVGKMGEFDTYINQSGQTPSEVGGIGLGSEIGSFDDGIDYTDMRKYDVPISSDSAAPPTAFLPPARPENIASLVDQAIENVKTQSGDRTSGDSTSGDTGAATTDNATNQQGGLLSGGIGSLLPLIVGMLNPTAGMALGIMQAMGGEGQGQGIFGNLFSSGKKETNPLYDFDTFDIGTGTDQRNFIEKFLGLKAGTIGPGEAQSVGDIGLPDNIQEKIKDIATPSVPDPILGEDGTYSCPLPYVYDPNTKMCVMMEAGLGGQGAAANQTKTPAGMQMGGQVNPSLNNAVDNFLQALA
jgi:hypothetical protein